MDLQSVGHHSVDLQSVGHHSVDLHSVGLQSVDLQSVGQEQGWCLREGCRGLRAQGQGGVQAHQGH